MNKSSKLIGSFLTVGGWTLLSRVAGLLRDLMMAGYLGTGLIAEAFQAAFALPNLFRRFFAEGAFNLAFVPLYSKKLAAGDNHEDFARDSLSILAGVLILLTLLAQLFMPWFIYAMASGFTVDGRFELAVDLSRIIFPYVLFISLAAVLSGILNAHGKFAAAAAAPVLLNLILITAMVFARYFEWDIGYALAWGVGIAGVAQLALVWMAVRSLGLRITLRIPKITPDLKRLLWVAMPALLTGGVIQINLLVGRQVASYFEGAFAWLYYADRLYQLPLGVVGIAIGIVLLPSLSKALQADDTIQGQTAFNRSLEFSLFLTLPAAVALFVIPLPIISVVFERGAFNHQDSIATASAVAIYGLGLPAFVLQKVLQPLFFAREDTKTPFKFALVTMVLNAVLAIGLAFQFGFLAAAIGTTVSAWIMVLLLWIKSRKMGPATMLDAQMKQRAPRILIASIIMGAMLALVYWVFGIYFYTPSVRYFALFAIIAFGSFVYFASAFAIGAFDRGELRSILRRHK